MRHRHARLTLAEYVRRRNGVPLGGSGSLRNMLRRSFGAGTFAGFWRFWNPIFGYYLGTYSFAPLRRVVPRPVALLLTFILCGFIHDLVTMALRGAPTFFFTPWFAFLATGVILGEVLALDVSDLPWAARASVNLLYLAVCLGATIATRAALEIP